MQHKKLVKSSEPQERWNDWFYFRKSEGITEDVALEHLKEQVKDSQMNWNHEHLQLREHFCKAMETGENLCFTDCK